MPRVAKPKLTLPEQLIQTEEDIKNAEIRIKELKLQRKNLEEAIRQDEVSKLYEAVKDSGKDVDEVIAIIKNS